MEPIISPWLVYFAGVVEGFRVACILLLFICIAVSIIIWVEINDTYNKEALLKYKRWLKKSIALCIIFGVLVILLPTKEMCMAMIAASYATQDNIQAVQGNIIDFVGKLTEAVSQNMK